MSETVHSLGWHRVLSQNELMAWADLKLEDFSEEL
jgi:hypothetical protein